MKIVNQCYTLQRPLFKIELDKTQITFVMHITITLILLITLSLLAILYASIVEWGLHRYVMHRPFLGFKYPFEAHAKIHHRIFKADDTYHLQDEKDKKTIPMAWWNWMLLVPASALPFMVLNIFIGHWIISAIVGAVVLLYYCAYEYLHWCMHLPKKRSIERSGIFFRLNGHHLLHHRYMGKNFNVVLPLADLFLGTLMLRSKLCFAQARGPSIPDVQPKMPAKSPKRAFFELP
jgi:hypothetical protein